MAFRVSAMGTIWPQGEPSELRGFFDAPRANHGTKKKEREATK